jgi:hypothetical protein
MNSRSAGRRNLTEWDVVKIVVLVLGALEALQSLLHH